MGFAVALLGDAAVRAQFSRRREVVAASAVAPVVAGISPAHRIRQAIHLRVLVAARALSAGVLARAAAAGLRIAVALVHDLPPLARIEGAHATLAHVIDDVRFVIKLVVLVEGGGPGAGREKGAHVLVVHA